MLTYLMTRTKPPRGLQGTAAGNLLTVLMAQGAGVSAEPLAVGVSAGEPPTAGVSAKRVPLLAIGLLGYVSPSITLLLGIFVFKEPIDMTQILAFVIVWIGLGFFTVGEFKRHSAEGI